MTEEDLDQLWTAAQHVQELANRYGRPADLVDLADELWAAHRCYRDEVHP